MEEKRTVTLGFTKSEIHMIDEALRAESTRLHHVAAEYYRNGSKTMGDLVRDEARANYDLAARVATT